LATTSSLLDRSKVGANALVPDWFATNVVEMEVHSCQWE